jgi:stress response protein YsnF
VVRKNVEQRTETVSDTVRKTEVDVEDERNVRGTGTIGSTDGKR